MEKESLTKSICYVCDVFCYEKVRFNKVLTREYTDSNDKVLKIVRGV